MHDPVFGTCRVTPLCRAFLYVPEHFRLQHIAMNHANIMQHGVHYSRREHCVAVMEMARRWAEEVSVNERLSDLIALAGLYHDVGHVALSHSMDDFVCSLGVPDHEQRSMKVLRHVNTRLRFLSEEEEEFVCDAISGNLRRTASYPPWAYHIVHQPNRMLPDVDRLVYVTHDTYKLGQCTGIDIKYITSMIYVDNNQHLRFRPECSDQLALVAHVRSELLRTVFRHPYVHTYQSLLVTLFCDLHGATRLVEGFRTDEWMELTDTLLWTTILRDPYSAERVITHV